MYRKAFLFWSILLSYPLVVDAHDGHGVFHGHQLEHYTSSPGHAVPLLLVTVVFLVWIAYRQLQRAERKSQ